MRAAGWSELPMDLLGHIIRNLPIPDYFRFGSVCTSWNSAVNAEAYRPKAQPPWLMIPNDDDKTSARFFSLSEKKSYVIPLPKPPIRSRLWIGSSHGWLITVDSQCEMHLLNPITATQIQLPSFLTLPFIDAVGYQNPIREQTDELKKLYDHVNYNMNRIPLRLRCWFFIKAVLSSPPSRDGRGDFIVMLIHNPGYKLAFARAGDIVWTPLRVPYPIRDIMLCRDFFYSLSFDGHIHAWPIADGLADLTRHVLPADQDGFSFRPTFISRIEEIFCERAHLVNSLDCDLMILNKNPYHKSWDCDRSLLFVMHQATREWCSAKDMLEDSVLFVGNNNSMSISATKFPELRKNSIYFTGDCTEIIYAALLYKLGRDVNHDCGVFDLKEKSVKPLECLPSQPSSLPPIWITPTLF